MKIPNKEFFQNKITEISSMEDAKNFFYFIENNILQSNLAISINYIFFLLTVQEKIKPKGSLQHSNYKTIILYCASIIESLLLYILKEYDRKKLLKKNILNFEWKYDTQILHKINENEEIIAGSRSKKYFTLNDNLQFQSINRIAHKSNILNKNLFQKAEKLRKQRNQIHLTGLRSYSDYFDQNDLNQAFNDLYKIIKCIEQKIKKI